MKFHPNDKAFHPTDKRLQSFEPFELYPHQLVERGPFDKFEFAAVGRRIMDPNTVIGLRVATKHDLGGQANSTAFPRRRRSR